MQTTPNESSYLPPRAQRWLSGGALTLMILLSLAIAAHGFGFQARISGDPTFHARFDLSPVFSSMHVIGGATVLLIGGFQFWASFRKKYLRVHRWMGRIYLTFVLIGGVGGLIIAPSSDGGLVANFGFGTLAVFWLFSGWQAYAHIRRRDIEGHKAWMMRNFAMAFGAVTLRIYLGLFEVAGVPFHDSYPVVAWISWVPNLILIEWYLALRLAKLANSTKAVPSVTV